MAANSRYNNNKNNWRGKWPHKSWSANGKYRSKFKNFGMKNDQSNNNNDSILNHELSSLSRGNTFSQKSISAIFPAVACPYKGWHLYMLKNFSHSETETIKVVKCFEDYVMRNSNVLKDIEGKQSFIVNLKELSEDEKLKQQFPDLMETIINSPQNIINSLGLAAHQVLSNELERSLREEAMKMLDDFGQDGDAKSVEESIAKAKIPHLYARLSQLNKITSLKSLKASYYGKLVSLKGTVVRVSSIKPLCKQIAFTCLECSTVQICIQMDGKYSTPTSCQNNNCQSVYFKPNLSHQLTKAVNWQNLRLQEIISDDKNEGGRVPRSIECELIEDLVDSCIPGDVIMITGIVKVNQRDEVKGSGKSEKSIFNLHIDANSVTNCKEGTDSAMAIGVEFSMKDYYAIEKIQSEQQLYKLLVSSLCPMIYGHEMVKAGLLLCLFGGCSKSAEDCVPVRGELHMLIVGDPGLGKSQMLRACANVAPRGVYVCGNTTTTAGLTVTLSREGGKGGDYALEGGALVLADQGTCCIDEFDKMSSQHLALLEAMEQQCISIAKAGIVCSLPARTSVLAAANPVGGHYNKAKTVAENIKMSGPLLSRFDLVFILMDKPDEELDNLLSEHVMEMHKVNRTKNTSFNNFGRIKRHDLMNISLTEEEKAHPLSVRLKLLDQEELDLIPQYLIRKYICYARKYVKPKLSESAANVIQSFYLELRKKHQNSDSTPITTRQLESLIRLAEARARCELREEVTEIDAKDIVEIMKFSMIDTYSDEFGFLDFQRSVHGSGTSNRAQVKKFVAGLQKLSDSMYKSLFTFDELKQLAKQINISTANFQEFIDNLNHQGFLIKKGSKVYQFSSAS